MLKKIVIRIFALYKCIDYDKTRVNTNTTYNCIHCYASVIPVVRLVIPHKTDNDGEVAVGYFVAVGCFVAFRHLQRYGVVVMFICVSICR